MLASVRVTLQEGFWIHRRGLFGWRLERIWFTDGRFWVTTPPTRILRIFRRETENERAWKKKVVTQTCEIAIEYGLMKEAML